MYFPSPQAVSQNACCRRVGNNYYTQGFAELLFREFLMADSKIKGMIPRLIMRAVEAGSELANLVSLKTRVWLPIIEDVFTSPVVKKLHADLRDEAVRHSELEAISIDATLRCCLRVVGQASYRSPAATRAQAAFDDDVASRRIITVRGRTSAVMGMWPAQREDTTSVVRCLRECLPAGRIAIPCHYPNDCTHLCTGSLSFPIRRLEHIRLSWDLLCIQPM